MLNGIQKKILQEVADMTGIPDGAVNIRSDGQKEYRQNSEHITIESKTDKDGIDIRIAPFTKNENVHIPVVLTKSGFQDMVYNDFFGGGLRHPQLRRLRLAARRHPHVLRRQKREGHLHRKALWRGRRARQAHPEPADHRLP